MTKYVELAVWDSAVQAYARPMYMQSVGQAIRSFGDEVNRKAEDNLLNKHPDDYELHNLGTWDDESGYHVTNDETRCVARAKDLKQD